MSIYGYETPKSRKWRQDAANGQLTREWFVGGSDDVLEVRDFLVQNNPPTFLGVSRKSVGADPLGAPDLWYGTVEYGAAAVLEGLKPDELSFKIAAASVHVTQSLETKYRLTSADPNPPVANGGLGSAPDMKGAIGVTLDSVQGTDILVPKMEFTYARDRDFVDFPYLRTLRNLVGKTNNATFYGFPAGTLLYLGCEPTSQVGTADDLTKFRFWRIAHSFAQEENRVNLPLAGITIPQKKGWWYVWARYAPQVDSGLLVQQPTGVYVERLYEEGNFELLEIGT